MGKGWLPQAAGEGMGMVRWEPGAPEDRNLQESCAAAVLCPALQVKSPLSTVHRPPPVSQVRHPSGPTRSSARVGCSPSCPSSFHISLVMPWLKPPCSCMLGLLRGDRSWVGAAKSGHICVLQCHCLCQPGNSPGSLCQCQRHDCCCCCSPAFHWQMNVGWGSTREKPGTQQEK